MGRKRRRRPAPSGVEAEGSADDNLASYAELAGALGADLEAEDLVLLDSREPNALTAAKEAFPLWARLPEVRADQVVAWGVPGSFSYTRTADFLESLTAEVEGADDLVG